MKRVHPILARVEPEVGDIIERLLAGTGESASAYVRRLIHEDLLRQGLLTPAMLLRFQTGVREAVS